MDKDKDAASTKATLERDLRKLEMACTRVSDANHTKTLELERERARLLPLQARRIALQQALAAFESSHVLLRSVFLRLRPDADGRVAVVTAADALRTLAPSATSAHAAVPLFSSTDAVLEALVQRQCVRSPPFDAQTLAFSDFVQCFERLFGASEKHEEEDTSAS